MRSYRIFSRAIAVLTLLALLLAPMCAPLCAAGWCGRASSSPHCHDMDGDSSSQLSLTAAQHCARSEFVAVLSKSNTDFLHEHRANASAAPAMGTDSGAGSHRTFTQDAQIVSHFERPSLLGSAVLRI
jgi:hypothetical protein